MEYAYQTIAALNELLRFYISYCKTNKSYLLKDKWAEEYNETVFSEEIEKFKSLLHLQLKYGFNQAKYLQDLLEQISIRIEWLKDNKANSPDFFELYPRKILQINNPPVKSNSNKEAYEKYINHKWRKSPNPPELFFFLSLHYKKLNSYKTISDFEKGILLYAIHLYSLALDDLYGYIQSINLYAEFIDFKSFDLEHLKNLSDIQINVKRCHFNLDKKSVAYLFRILLEEKFIEFNDNDSYKNELEMKKFVEANFTIFNQQKMRVPIKNFNREYSQMKSRQIEYIKKRIKIIDELSEVLANRKNKLNKKLKKYNEGK